MSCSNPSSRGPWVADAAVCRCEDAHGASGTPYTLSLHRGLGRIQARAFCSDPCRCAANKMASRADGAQVTS